MLKQLKIFTCVILFLTVVTNAHAQKSCCASKSTDKTACTPAKSSDQQSSKKACCSSSSSQTSSNESTSGCTPSSCRGAQTKFGEAKVISELRLHLIALKAKMEKHQSLKFSAEAISVHNIIGETDDESLEIVSTHVGVIETELYAVLDQDIPSIEPSENKAIRVKQLKERIATMTEYL